MSGRAQRMKHDARINAQNDGHYLTTFKRAGLSPGLWAASCVKCGMVVEINTNAGPCFRGPTNAKEEA